MGALEIRTLQRTLIILLLAAFTLPACDQGSSTAPTTRPSANAIREWRITEALDPAQVGAEVLAPESTTTVACVEQPGRIKLILPDGEAHEAEPYLVQAAQDQQRLTYMRLLFPSESLDSAVARAQLLMQEWNMEHPADSAKLEKWRAERERIGYKPNTQSDPLHVTFDSAKDLRFPRQVEIRPSFYMDRPWYVAVGISFYGELERQRQATTGPASAPTSQSK